MFDRQRNEDGGTTPCGNTTTPLYKELAMKAYSAEKLSSIGSIHVPQPTENLFINSKYLQKLQTRARVHVNQANRWQEIAECLGVAGVVFADWMPPAWFKLSQKGFAIVLNKASEKRGWLRETVGNILDKRGIVLFYPDRNTQSQIEILQQQLDEARNTINELTSNHRNEVKDTVFVVI